MANRSFLGGFLLATLFWAGPAALLLGAVPARAAPTCQDIHGGTIKCATPGAMPLGWKPSAQMLWERELAQTPDQNIPELLKVLGGLALFLAMIALLPRFDGKWGDDD